MADVGADDRIGIGPVVPLDGCGVPVLRDLTGTGVGRRVCSAGPAPERGLG